jgi:hypothetical protein
MGQWFRSYGRMEMSVRKEEVSEASSGSRFKGGVDRAGMFVTMDAFRLQINLQLTSEQESK